MWEKGAVDSVHLALQRGLHVAERIVGGIATATGIYGADRTIYTVVEAVAPVIGFL